MKRLHPRKHSLFPSPKTTPLSKRARSLLRRLRIFLKDHAPKMKQLGYPLDGSYCHIGAAFSGAYLVRQGLHVQLFQPRSYHMLARFRLEGRTYFVDQTMAQFFAKGTAAHKHLMTTGGFVGTREDFVRFYHRYIDDIEAWGGYQKGGELKENTSESEEIFDPYLLWEADVKQLGLNSRKDRVHRLIECWYQDFRTDTSHDQGAGLMWTARYFFHHFSIKIHVAQEYSKE